MNDRPLSPFPAQSTEYRSLYKYLHNRFADTVVLTFREIESLLGFSLPDGARLREDWWSNESDGVANSTHSSSWIGANRLATANLSAQCVTFERRSE